MTFRLVRGEPTDSMIEAAQEEISERQKVGCGIYLADIWPVVLAAHEPLTDAEIDELCWQYESTHKHGPADHWERDPSGAWASVAPLHEKRRIEDRTRMRAFVAALTGAKP